MQVLDHCNACIVIIVFHFSLEVAFRLLSITLMTANSTYPIELMHSVACRMCIFVFANVPFKGHFV